MEDDLDDDDLQVDDDGDEEVDVDGIDDQEETEGIVNEIIDIRDPLNILKKKLEAKLEVDLSQHEFYLQSKLWKPENNIHGLKYKRILELRNSWTVF